MTKVGFQLYSLKAVDDPLPTVLERVSETPFHGVEFAGLNGGTVDQAQTVLKRTELQSAGAHVGLDEIEVDPEGMATTYRRLGCEHVAVPWLDPEHFESHDRIAAVAERLDAAAEELSNHGLTLHYHNHDQEFTSLGGSPAIEILLDLTETVRFQLDVGWAGAAGYDPLLILETFGDRIELVHLKDFDESVGETVPVGEGDLEIDRLVESVHDLDIEWLIYEAEDEPDSYETLTHAASIVADYW